MQKHFTREIDELKESIIKMAEMVSVQVSEALNVLESGNIDNVEALKGKDKKVDAYENLIQVQCENIFALFQPVAIDLRYVMTSIKINNELERCGDIAVNIANKAKKTVEKRDLVQQCGVIDMGKEAGQMVEQALKSFTDRDINLAKKIILSDEAVDKMNKKIFKFLVNKMKENPECIEPASHLIVLTRQIERLADHATNIAEDVIFLYEAKLVNHSKK